MQRVLAFYQNGFREIFGERLCMREIMALRSVCRHVDGRSIWGIDRSCYAVRAKAQALGSTGCYGVTFT